MRSVGEAVREALVGRAAFLAALIKDAERNTSKGTIPILLGASVTIEFDEWDGEPIQIITDSSGPEAQTFPNQGDNDPFSITEVVTPGNAAGVSSLPHEALDHSTALYVLVHADCGYCDGVPFELEGVGEPALLAKLLRRDRNEVKFIQSDGGSCTGTCRGQRLGTFANLGSRATASSIGEV